MARGDADDLLEQIEALELEGAQEGSATGLLTSEQAVERRNVGGERATRLNQLRRRLADQRSGGSGGLTDEQKSRLFARMQQEAEAGARSEVGNLAARFGGDTSGALFNFIAQQSIGGARSGAAARRADIEIEESRRAEDLALERSRIDIGMRQVGVSERGQRAQERQFGRQFELQRSGQEFGQNLQEASFISGLNPAFFGGSRINEAISGRVGIGPRGLRLGTPGGQTDALGRRFSQ